MIAVKIRKVSKFSIFVKRDGSGRTTIWREGYLTFRPYGTYKVESRPDGIRVSFILPEGVDEEELEVMLDGAEAEIKRIELLESINSNLIKSQPILKDRLYERHLVVIALHILCLLVEKKDREVVKGDLLETHEEKARKRSRGRADMWLYYEVARSVWPLLRRLVVLISGRIIRARQLH